MTSGGFCRDESHQSVKTIIRSIAKELRATLILEAETQVTRRIVELSNAEPHSKTSILAKKFHSSGPAIAVALDWVGPTSHAAAVAAFFSGDFFLGRYAGNFFAKAMLPSGVQHLAKLSERGIDRSRVCLRCWHARQELYLENEEHLLLECPAYSAQRHDYIAEITTQSASTLASSTSQAFSLNVILASHASRDWAALGRYLARVRQIRRRMKVVMCKLGEQRHKNNFGNVKENRDY
jgi:hypothetical protein